MTATIDQAARLLREAQQTRTPCARVTTLLPTLSVADAYRIQSINASLRIHERGMWGPPAHQIGLKIGLTSRAVQDWLQVKEPDFGVLLSDMVVEDGGDANLDVLLQPRAEGEIAFVLKRDLAGPGVTVADVIQATDFLLPAIEIIDSRIQDWDITYPDTIADNASSGLFVLGTTPVSPLGVDLALAGMSMRKNGVVVSTGCGAACLGHPANAVAWLANTFGRLGRRLHAGDVVLSGALGPVTNVAPGDRVDVQIARIGSVACNFRRSAP